MIVCSICAVYWVYLVYSAEMQISCDAKSYEESANAINEYGIRHYFQGLNREPLYPFLVGFSMKIGRLLSLQYYYVLKIIQVLFLFITQMVALALLSRLKVSYAVRLIAICYIGFSPALVNSAFSLFSEITSYPFVLGIVLVSAVSWNKIRAWGYYKIASVALLLSILFLLATFVKGVFQYVFIVFLFPWIWIILRGIRRKDKVLCNKASLHIFILVLTFGIAINGYKYLNYKCNKNFDFTTRYAGWLYSTALKRMQKLTPRMFLLNLASVPGDGFARMFFSPEEVRSVSYLVNDELLGSAINLSNDELLRLAKSKAFEHPFQYLLFTGIEGVKLFFWESTNIGFVEYPQWLQDLFKNSIVRNGIRLVVSLLSVVSFAWLFILVIRKRKLITQVGRIENLPIQLSFFIFLMISSFTGLYSLFSILTRYAFPIAPLYIVTAAFFIDSLLSSKRISR